MRSIRLLPVVILTAIMLLGLKGFNLLTADYGGLTGVDPALAQAEDSTTPEPEQAGDATTPEPVQDAQMAPVEAPPAQPTEIPSQTSRDTLLERLGERRVVMEEREQDLRVREQLLEAAERRLEERMAELTALEARVTASADEADARESQEIARLVEVYSAMRAKDAAAIFDLLDMPILMEVANAMNPRKMADILGEMTPEIARSLTIALAGTPTRPVLETSSGPADLPRIEGQPIQ